jgi:hypothetical protein
LVLNNKGWAEKYYGLHQFLAVYYPIPDPTRPGEMLVTITMPQAQTICDQAYTVADKFDLLKYLNTDPGKWGSLAFFGVTMGIVYVPKIKIMAQMVRMMKEAQAGQEANATFASAEPQMPHDPNQGVFKYGP